ncbi:hypothetical protein BKA63DRAFT_565296 [Paraphoma chrysanthemicola]|nr:hypothetical protein BKA63DRAFT_565296 [Paraphoma chrysanthemicola]
MTEPSPNPASELADPEPTPIANGTPIPTDIEMTDSLPIQEAPPTPNLQPTVQTATPTPAPAPQQAPPASSRNSPHPSAPVQQAPTQPIPHGSPTRVYLNTHVTPHLLEAMKHLATTEPEKPLKWLSEFLAAKSAEIEG